MARIPKNSFNYEIQLTGKSIYDLKLECNIEGLLTQVFTKARRLQVYKDKLSKTQVVEIQPFFYNLVKSILHRKVADISRIVAKDKIKLLTFNIESAIFSKDSKDKDNWIFSVKYGGECQDDRPEPKP